MWLSIKLCERCVNHSAPGYRGRDCITSLTFTMAYGYHMVNESVSYPQHTHPRSEKGLVGTGVTPSAWVWTWASSKNFSYQSQFLWRKISWSLLRYFSLYFFKINSQLYFLTGVWLRSRKRRRLSRAPDSGFLGRTSRKSQPSLTSSFWVGGLVTDLSGKRGTLTSIEWSPQFSTIIKNTYLNGLHVNT